jgi:hypothetical protein
MTVVSRCKTRKGEEVLGYRQVLVKKELPRNSNASKRFPMSHEAKM